MARNDKQDGKPTQKTPKGHEIPVPTKKEVEDFLKGVTGKRTSKGEDADTRRTPEER
jgi:hypothetical protein